MKRNRWAFAFFGGLLLLLTAVGAHAATHDVSIDSVTVNPGKPKVNEEFKIEAQASNLGTEEEKNVTLIFSVDGAETGQKKINKLKPEETKSVSDNYTFVSPGEYRVAVAATLDGDENPANDMKEIVVTADDDDPPPAEEPPPAEDPPPADDDGTGGGDDDDSGFLLAFYNVRVENNTGSAVRFEFSLDSFEYDRGFELASGTSITSDTYRTSADEHRLNGRWQVSGSDQWNYVGQTLSFTIFSTREFSFTLESAYGRVEGVVVDDDGPLSGAAVALISDTGAEIATVKTDRNGRFAFNNVETGKRYSLRISRKGYIDKTRDLGRVTGDIDLGRIYLEAVDTGPGDDDPEPPADSDGDGVIDDDDAFPDNPDESVDTDGDGIGDNADTDDDGDGMPDSWESSHGLNPLVDDAAGDPDGDGASNLDEFRSGTDPNAFEENFPPGPPLPESPSDNASDIPIAARLESGGFSDSDGDEHARTRWQIAMHPDFTRPAFDVETERFLTRLDVPNLVLLGETTYYWRVRYIDSRGAASAWSATRTFTTRAWAADGNRNGVADDYEFIEYSDMDGNGVTDLEQEDIGCVKAAGEGERVVGVLCPESAGFIEGLTVIADGSVEDENGRPEQMPFGLINFRINLRETGGTVRLRVYLSEPPGDGMGWYKYNPMTGWIDLSGSATFEDDGRVVTLELRDGGDGDVDGVANGVIVDPSGVGVGAATIGQDDDDDDDDEGGTWYVGCFVRSLVDRFSFWR